MAMLLSNAALANQRTLAAVAPPALTRASIWLDMELNRRAIQYVS